MLNMNNIAAAGMVATLANNIPMFGMMKQMDTRGKVINCAFAVSAAFALGDHLGFAAANMNAMIFPMIVGKFDRRRNGDWRGDDAGAKRRRDRD